MPKRFPAEVAPDHGRLLGCAAPPRVECWFLVSGDSHRTYRQLAGQARPAGWVPPRRVQGLGEDGARVSPDADVPALPNHVPEGAGLVDISWGRAEDGG
jgi:hypothetical protein